MATVIRPETLARTAKVEPSLLECLSLFVFGSWIQFAVYSSHGGYWNHVTSFLDNRAYLFSAWFIRSRPLPFDNFPQHFFGLPLCIAGISRIFSLSQPIALILLSSVPAVLVCILIYRLYGGVVLAAFVILTPDWFRVSVLGASEPLFMLLFLGSFVLARTHRWKLAAFVAALSTTVRPVGVFAVLGLLIVLAKRRLWRELFWAASIAAAVGSCYLLIAQRLTGHALFNFVSYRPYWFSGSPLTFPLRPLIGSIYNGRAMWGAPLWAWSLISVWTVASLLLAGFVFWRKRFDIFGQPEVSIVFLYVGFMLMYNISDIAWHWSRFMIPVLPTLLFGVREYLPNNRYVLWVLTVAAACIYVIDVNKGS